MNISVVDNSTQGAIFRGPQPQTVADYLQLQALGIKYALDLETGAGWLGDGDPLQEAIVCDGYGIRVYSHPIGAVLPPSRQELSDGLAFMMNHRPVYVHCRQGVDRTGMICAAYRMKVQGWSASSAIAEMKQLGFHWWYTFWIQSLENL